LFIDARSHYDSRDESRVQPHFFGGILACCDIFANVLPLQRKERVFVVSAFWRQSAWRLVVPVEFIFVTLGFALRLPVAFAATKEQQRKQPKHFTAPLALIARLNLLASLGGPRKAARDETCV
jgi:hypothetical protein